MDLVRVTRYDGSVSLYVPLRSIRAYQTGVNKRSPTMLSHWRLAMLDSDRLRGVWARPPVTAVRLLPKSRC